MNRIDIVALALTLFGISLLAMIGYTIAEKYHPIHALSSGLLALLFFSIGFFISSISMYWKDAIKRFLQKY